VISEAPEWIWEEHRSIVDDWRPERLNRLMERVLAAIGDDRESALLFLRGITRSLVGRASDSEDLFARTEVVGCAAMNVLPFIESDQGKALAVELRDEWRSGAQSTASALLEHLSADRFALVGLGLPEFHLLPLRVCKVLGWIGALALVENTQKASDMDDKLRSLAELTVEHYSGSLRTRRKAGSLGVPLCEGGREMWMG
jgi:hypothetical protein